MNKSLPKILLYCGIASTLVYFAIDIICALLYPGYSYTDQTVSELSAIGAPTAPFWRVMTFVYNPLLIAFGIGVYISAGLKRSQRITGILLVLWGILGFVWLLFPMNIRGNIGTASDTGHLVMAAVTIFLMLMFLAIGSGIGGKDFRLYSILTIINMMVFGAYTGTQAAKVAENLPTPWMGITERVSVFSPVVWVLVLGVVLLRSTQGSPSQKNKRE